MLQGRIAPPCSPAVGLGDTSSGTTPQPMSRRNSFTREMAATIAQQRTQPSENGALDSIQLHVNDALRPLSPRKSASFSLPKTPRKDDADADMAARVLRPTLSDYQLRRSIDAEEAREAASTRPSLVMFKEDVYLGEQSVEALTLDSPVKVVDDQVESSSESSSPATSSYSPLSPTNDGEHDDDAFESWLLDARVLESPMPALKQTASHDGSFKPPVASAESRSAESQVSDLSTPWLQAQRSPPIELSKSVQQIEHEIRNAIDSAATRVTSDLQRRDSFQQSIQSAVGSSTELTQHTKPHVTAEEPELLLLMEVLIGDGRSESIEIHVGDQPERLAEAFAQKHGLGADAIPRLAQHIQDQLDALDEEEQEEEQEDQREAAQQPTREGPDRGQYQSSPHHAYVDQDGDEEEDPYADYRVHEYESSHQLPPPPPTSAHYDNRDQYDRPPAAPQEETLMRENEREHSYRHLMEKYGHYTAHSNKVNPTHGQKPGPSRHTSGSSDAGRNAAGASGRSPTESHDPSEPLTMQNVEHARLMFTPRPVAFGSSSKAAGKEKETVYNRLYSLAEAREKWIRRQQKAKAADEIKARQSQMKLEISAKSRDMIAGRGNGGYAHIGERLYDEALSDLAKKQRECEKRQIERQQQVDWTCPKCAFVNQHGDAVCKNIVASLPPPQLSSSYSSGGASAAAYETTYNPSTTMALLDTHPEVVCGYLRPQQLFRPTLIAAASNATTHSVHSTKLRSSSITSSSLNNQSQRRQRTQQQMEDEFRQTCPFKPKINDMSEEIMRDKLEQEAKAKGSRQGQASVTTTPTGEVRRKNPHKALYEDAFHARAHREAKEQEYMAQFTFKPNIGVNALWSNDRGDDDVVERLAVVKYQELERKRTSLHSKYAPDRDPTTGREYFKPETGRAPIFNRNERGLPIGEFLYEAHKEHAEYHRRLRQQETDEVKRQSEQGFVSGKSKQALHQRKKKTCARLFDCLVKRQMLSGDGDGSSSATSTGQPRIVPSTVDMAQLPQEIARIVSIVFEFAGGQPIAFAEFEQFMDKLMTDVPGLTCTQILFLTESLNDGKSARRSVDKAALTAEEEADEAELTFHPVIDKNSAAMAKKHGRAERAKVFEALNQYYDHYKDRADQATKQREREFARTHPFQPTFHTKDRKTKASSFYAKLHRSEMLAPTTSTTATASSKSHQPESAAPPSLRTAVPNARPFVRPIQTDGASSHHERSRANSIASSKHSDDEDAALTSRVLAALDDRPVSQLQPSPSASSSTAFSAVFSSSVGSAASAPSASLAPHSEAMMSLSDLAM